MADMGRPSVYTDQLAKDICLEISTSTKSVKKICKDNDKYPTSKTVFAWRLTKPDFCDLYNTARQARVELMVDEMLDISDDVSHDSKLNARGEEVCDAEYVARSRLRIDTRKWLASKLMPKVYGEKQEVVQTSTTHMTISEHTQDIKDAAKAYEKAE